MQRFGLGLNDSSFPSPALCRNAVVPGRAKRCSPNPQGSPWTAAVSSLHSARKKKTEENLFHFCCPSPPLWGWDEIYDLSQGPTSNLQMPFSLWWALVCQQIASAEHWQVTTSCCLGGLGFWYPCLSNHHFFKEGFSFGTAYSALTSMPMALFMADTARKFSCPDCPMSEMSL